MSNYINIERAILCTVLENEFITANDYIREFALVEEYFTTPFHKFLVRGINRLKELNEPVDTDTLMVRFRDANKWAISYDDELLNVITTNSLGETLFKQYNELLEKNYFESHRRGITI